MDLMSEFNTPTCDPWINLNFVATVTTFRIIVLTYNRPMFLYRLLKSLEEADYAFEKNNPHWNIILEIRVDVGGGAKGDQVQKIAKKFKFSHGIKEIHIEEEPRGILNAWPWRHAWRWREGELFMVVEDDAEMSPHWYRALVNMWSKYGSNEHLGGMSLEHQMFTVTHGFNIHNISNEVSDLTYFYMLASSTGFSPHPCHWRNMMRLYGDKLGKCPPGYGCGGQVWETWWTEYHLDNLLYTLYTADQGAFAVDHRGAGYHHDVSPGRMCEKIEHWNAEREQENLVEQPQMLDLYLNKNFGFAKLSWMAKKIAKKFQFLLIRFILTTEDLRKIEVQMNKSNTSASAWLSQTIFVTFSDDFELQLLNAKVQNVVSIRSGQMISMVNEYEKASYILWVTATLHTLAINTVTLPIEIDLDSFPEPQDYIITGIGAGKLQGQKHPRLDFLYLDSSEETKEALLMWLEKSTVEKRFYSSILSDIAKISQWSWVKI